jgi:hypothetical protein
LDAIVQDSETTKNALPKADHYIFVHNAMRGELTEEERMGLQMMTKGAASFLRHDNFIVAGTHLDQCEDGWPEIQEKIESQLSVLLGFIPPVIGVSFPDYKDGVLSDSEELCELSGIPRLRRLLEKRVTQSRGSIKAERIKRIHHLREAVLNELEMRRQEVCDEQSRIKHRDNDIRIAMSEGLKKISISAKSAFYSY